MWSSRQLFEVMVDFWSNHLNVTNPFDGGWDVRTPYDNDVIRKHALGRFSDMLHASRPRHPAMMRYLDNAGSDKRVGQRELRPRAARAAHGRHRRRVHREGRPAERVHHDRAHRRPTRASSPTTPDRHWTGPVKVLGFSHPNASAAEGLAVGEQYLQLPRDPPVDREAHRPQAGRAVRLRRPAADAGATGSPTVLSGQRHGDRAGAADAVQLGGVLDRRPA